MSISVLTVILIAAMAAEYIDSTLGMGYGTSLTPILLIAGFEPMQVIPAILVSELVTGIAAGFTHHSFGNADFRPRTMNLVRIIDSIREYGPIHPFRESLPRELRVVMLLAAASVIGTFIAAAVTVSVAPAIIRGAISVIIISVGFIIIFTRNLNLRFSWKRITVLGVIASFNKALSGGGYGPLVTGGQLVAGMNPKNAVAITSLAEGLTCASALILLLLMGQKVDLALAPWLTGGALLSVPLSALTVRKMKTASLKLVIGSVTVLLGSLSFMKMFLK